MHNNHPTAATTTPSYRVTVSSNTDTVWQLGQSEPRYISGPNRTVEYTDSGWETVQPLGANYAYARNGPRWERVELEHPSTSWTTTTGNTVGWSDWHDLTTRTWSATGDKRLDKKEQERLKKANAKADRLLKSWLSDAEYNYLMEDGQLEIPSKSEEDVIYIVKKQANAKVKKLKKGKPVCELCLTVGDGVPDGDVLLSKILMIKTDEEKFLTTANKWAIQDWEASDIRITQHDLDEAGKAIPKAMKALSDGVAKAITNMSECINKINQTVTPGIRS